MNILVISSILPIPGIRHANDFVFQTYSHYRKLYEEDKIVIINPVRYDFSLFKILRGRTGLQKFKGRRKWLIDDFHVEIFPFLSTWRLRNLHACVTRSVYYINQRRLKYLFSQHNFDIIHANYIFSDGILAYLLSKKYRIPYLVNTHNERFYFQHGLSRRMARRILDAASFVLPLNYSNYLYFKSIGVRNLEHAPLGFNKVFLREQRTDQNEKINILTVSELIKLKNIDQVLHALRRITEHFEVTYTIIGKGPEKEHLQSTVESLGLEDHVHFIDAIPHDQIAGEMHKHDIFIMPSFFETFGRVYFEAMAMGIPVICARDSGIYGIFKDREEGIAVDHRSIDSIVEGLEHLLSDRNERLRIGRNGQELVKHFTWENIAEGIYRKYEMSISGHQQPQ